MNGCTFQTVLKTNISNRCCAHCNRSHAFQRDRQNEGKLLKIFLISSVVDLHRQATAHALKYVDTNVMIEQSVYVAEVILISTTHVFYQPALILDNVMYWCQANISFLPAWNVQIYWMALSCQTNIYLQRWYLHQWCYTKRNNKWFHVAIILTRINLHAAIYK